MLTRACLIILFTCIHAITFSQTQIWFENFEGETNNAVTGTAAGVASASERTWSVTSTPSGGASTFSKQSTGFNRFTINQSGSEGVWATNVVDISGYGQVGIDISLVSYYASATDYVRAYYKLDGGPEILFGSVNGGDYSINANASIVLSGSTLQVVVRGMENTAGSTGGYPRMMRFDDLEIVQVRTLYSRNNGNWGTNGTWSTIGLGGASCACTPDNTSNVVVGNSNIVSITGQSDVVSVTVQDNGVLRWTANADLNITRGGSLLITGNGSVFRNGNNGSQLDFDYAAFNSIVINSSNANAFAAGDIEINGDATVTISGSGNLNIADDLLINGAATIVNNLTGTLTVNDDLNINTANGTLTNNGTIIINGDIIVNDNADDDNTIVNASGASLGYVLLDANSADLDILNSGTINQSGNFTDINSADSNFDNYATGVWNWSLTPNTTYDTDIHTVLDLSAAGNTFNYTGNGAQRIAPIAYHHIGLSGAGAKDGNNASFAIRGNWAVTGSATFTEGNTTLTFNGADNQFITNAAGETFSRLVINKSGGSLTLNNPVTITNATGTGLTLTQGIINSSSSALLTLNDNVVSTSGNAVSYVDGPIRKIGNDAFVFPTGNGVRWARIGISAPTGATTQFTAQYFANPYSIFDTDATLTHISGAEYWTLDRAVTTASAAVTLYWENSFSDITDFADLRIAHFTGSQWVSAGNAGTTGATAGPGTITSGSLTSFSPFSFGSGGGINPLPIELINFNARIKNHQVELTWQTASELNNDYFTIERAVDVENFEVIGERVKGKGTTNQRSDYKFMDTHPVYGRSYYRLKQTDFDGTFTYSKVELIDFEGPAYPVFEANPTLNKGKEITLKAEGLRDLKEFPVKIINAQGEVVWQKVIQIKHAGSLEETIVFDRPLPAGFYILRGPSIFFTQKIVVE